MNSISRNVALLMVLAAPHASGAQAHTLTRAIVDPRATPLVRVAEANEWYEQGENHFASERFKESIAAFERAMQLGRMSDGAWQVARGYARLGNKKQALRWISHALDAGYVVERAMSNDVVFDAIRDDPAFRQLTIKRAKPSYPFTPTV